MLLSPSIQRNDRFQRDLLASPLPIQAQGRALSKGPLDDHAMSPPWQAASKQFQGFNCINSLKPPILGMEVRRKMID